MLKLKLLLFILALFFCLQMQSQSKSDQQLKKELYKELVEMDKRGATFQDLFTAFLKQKTKRYIATKEEFYRKEVLLDFAKEKYIEAKILEGTLTPEDEKEIAIQVNEYETYEDYLAYKKSDEAIANWEDNFNDSILKLKVNNLKNITENEQQKLDELLKFLSDKSFIKSVLVTDVLTTKEIKRNDKGTLEEEILSDDQ
ncbi:hypothetical protein [Lacinutrix salivirga]